MIAEVSDSVGKSCCQLGGIAASEVLTAEIAIVGAINDSQNRGSNGVPMLLGSAADVTAFKSYPRNQIFKQNQ
jgi:hypothetical protein